MKFILKIHAARDPESTGLELLWRLLETLHPKLGSPELRGKASTVLKDPHFPESIWPRKEKCLSQV